MRTFSVRLRTMIALLALAAFLLAGCAGPAQEETQQPEETPPQEETQKPEEETPKKVEYDPDTFMTDILPAAECLNSCFHETFGAEVDYDTIYHAGFDADGAPHLYLDGEALPEGCEEDGSYASYFPVSNFSSIAEVRNSLTKYLTEEVLTSHPLMPDMLEHNFLEYEGALYLWRGARGYGAVNMDLESMEYLGEVDGLQQVKVPFYLITEYTHDSVLSFEGTENGWMIVGIEDCQG